MAAIELVDFTRKLINEELSRQGLDGKMPVFFTLALNNGNSSEFINKIASVTDSIFVNLEESLGIDDLKEIVENEIGLNIAFNEPDTKKYEKGHIEFCDLIAQDIMQIKPQIIQFGITYPLEGYNTIAGWSYFIPTYKFFEVFLSLQLDVYQGQKITIGNGEEGLFFYEFNDEDNRKLRFEMRTIHDMKILFYNPIQFDILNF